MIVEGWIYRVRWISVMKKLLSVFVALIWFGMTNHCYVTEAFASNSGSPHDCCDTSKKQGGTHDRSSDDICCKLFVQNGQHSIELLPPLSLLVPLLPVDGPVDGQRAALYLVRVVAVNDSFQWQPPPGEVESLLTALVLAPNAPPVSL